jgi:acyl-CoA dehydrogenase
MAKGKLVASIAFSEPGTGADPRRLRTTAERDGDHFILNGGKAFLTNGPLADFFIVYAVTGIDRGKKRLSAFLVPRKNKNLTVAETTELDFLRPSPHCTIRLEDCRMPLTARLGREGTALEEMARPCRMLEDTLLNGPILGGIAWQMDLMLDGIRRKGTPADDIKRDIGEMEMRRRTFRWMAREAARQMEKKSNGGDPETLLVSFRALAADSQSTAARIMERTGIPMEGELASIVKDIHRALDLLRGGDPSRQKKLGEKVFGGKEANERVRR